MVQQHTRPDIETASVSPPFPNDSKQDIAHLEVEAKVLQEKVVDEDAAGYTDNTLVIDEAENKRLRRIINKRILVLMCLVYICQALDKGSTGPISIMGWLEDVKATGQDYAMTSTVMWCGIVIGEPLAAQLVRRFPVAKILTVSMIAWTALAFGLTFSLNIPAILVNRALLGFFESTFNPCLVTITVQWYKRSEQPWISAIWQSMVALSTAISSIIAWGLSQVNYPNSTGLRGWQWVLMIISMLSACMTVVVFFMLPDSPTKAKWADNDLKTRFVERVRSNNQGLKHTKWKSDQAWETFKDPNVYGIFCIALCQTLVVGGIGKFNSLLINRAFGFDNLTSQLLKIPMSLCGVGFYYLMAFFIWKFHNTLYAMCGFAVVNAIGTIVLVVVTPGDATRGGLFFAFILMQCFSACNTAMFLMLSRNIAGSTKKSIAYGTSFMAWGGGNALSPQLFWNEWAPRYIPSLYIHLGLYGTFIILCLSLRALLAHRNKKKDDAQRNEEGVVVSLNSHAFEDLTDIQNPDFRYSL